MLEEASCRARPRSARAASSCACGNRDVLRPLCRNPAQVLTSLCQQGLRLPQPGLKAFDLRFGQKIFVIERLIPLIFRGRCIALQLQSRNLRLGDGYLFRSRCSRLCQACLGKRNLRFCRQDCLVEKWTRAKDRDLLTLHHPVTRLDKQLARLREPHHLLNRVRQR